jgi:hypothetical protein
LLSRRWKPQQMAQRSALLALELFAFLILSPTRFEVVRVN